MENYYQVIDGVVCHVRYLSGIARLSAPEFFAKPWFPRDDTFVRGGNSLTIFFRIFNAKESISSSDINQYHNLREGQSKKKNVHPRPSNLTRTASRATSPAS